MMFFGFMLFLKVVPLGPGPTFMGVGPLAQPTMGVFIFRRLGPGPTFMGERDLLHCLSLVVMAVFFG